VGALTCFEHFHRFIKRRLLTSTVTRENGFNQLKMALTTAPILIFPDFSRVILETDTSSTALAQLLVLFRVKNDEFDLIDVT
jgi:hypothetical protein